MVRRVHLALLALYRRLPVRARRFVVRLLNPTYTVGSIAVIERDGGSILLVRHSYRRRWGLPGGILRRGELPADAAVRETLEEVGLAIEAVAAPSIVVDAEPRRVDIVFRCQLAPGADPDAARSCSPEIVEARWFPAASLPELQHEAAGALRALGLPVSQ